MATLELAVIAPALLLFFGLLVMAGRVNSAHSALDDAAAQAARAASLSRTADAASMAGEAAARSEISQRGLNCMGLEVIITTAGFSRAVGMEASVSAVVTCTVEVRDLTVPGMKGNVKLEGKATSPLDRYRGRE